MSSGTDDGRQPPPVPRQGVERDDTQADAPRRLPPPKPREAPLEPDAGASPNEQSTPAPDVPPPVRPRRAPLGAIQIYQAQLRKMYDHQSGRHDLRVPHPSQKAPTLVEVMFVRTRDRTQRAIRVGRDGIRVLFAAEGKSEGGAASVMTVVVEGLSFKVSVLAGYAPQTTLERLAQTVASEFVVEIHRESEESAFLRFVRPS